MRVISKVFDWKTLFEERRELVKKVFRKGIRKIERELKKGRSYKEVHEEEKALLKIKRTLLLEPLESDKVRFTVIESERTKILVWPM